MRSGNQPVRERGARGYLLLTGLFAPRRGNGQAFVAAVEEPEDVAAKDVSDVLHPADAGPVRLHGPVRHVKGGVYDGLIIFLRCMLQERFARFVSALTFQHSHRLNPERTRYLSVATETRIRSSPTRTFSPSDLCFDAGCTVHQQASPCEWSCRPTSKESLSLEEQVERQARYWSQKVRFKSYLPRHFCRRKCSKLTMSLFWCRSRMAFP